MPIYDPKTKKEYCKIEQENHKKLYSTKEMKALEKNLYKQRKYVEKERDEAIRKVAESDAKAFLEANYGAFILHTGYADDTEALMEHGSIFRNLQYVQISHH